MYIYKGTCYGILIMIFEGISRRAIDFERICTSILFFLFLILDMIDIKFRPRTLTWNQRIFFFHNFIYEDELIRNNF